MGIEYELRFRYPSQDDLEDVLVTMRRFERIEPNFSSYEFRDPGTSGSMPDASARIEAYGIYFCDHGGKGREIRDELVERLQARFGAVSVEEL